jgi:phage tail sheath gpL-like
MAQTKITITHDKEVPGDLQSKLITAQASKLKQVSELRNIIEDIMLGNRMGIVATVIDNGDAVTASGTLTLTGAGAASDTILINGVTLTAVASGAVNNQWNVGGTATLSAAAIASAINASSTALVSGQVIATSALGVVTIKALASGVTGNAITTAKGVDAGSVMTFSGARLTSGAAPTLSASASYNFGV